MPKSSKAKPTPAELDAAHAAARNTDSGPETPAPSTAGAGDPPTQKAIDTQAVVQGMPANSNKPLEYGESQALTAPQGLSVEPPSRLPGASTLSESNFSAKTGSVALEGVNATIDSLDRVRVDSSGQVLTTN